MGALWTGGGLAPPWGPRLAGSHCHCPALGGQVLLAGRVEDDSLAPGLLLGGRGLLLLLRLEGGGGLLLLLRRLLLGLDLFEGGLFEHHRRLGRGGELSLLLARRGRHAPPGHHCWLARWGSNALYWGSAPHGSHRPGLHGREGHLGQLAVWELDNLQVGGGGEEEGGEGEKGG